MEYGEIGEEGRGGEVGKRRRRVVGRDGEEGRREGRNGGGEKRKLLWK